MKRPINNIEKNKVNVHFQNVMSTQSVVLYVLKKIKAPKFSGINLKNANVSIKKEAEHGHDKYSVTFSIIVNNVNMFFREVGNNLYQLIDAIVAKVNRKLSKMRSNRAFKKHVALKYEF